MRLCIDKMKEYITDNKIYAHKHMVIHGKMRTFAIQRHA